MDKKEFLQKFRTALSGQVPAYIIEENVRYYDEYIETQKRQGKSEEEVLAELGNPRLLAKTVITTNKNAGKEQESTGSIYEKQQYEEHRKSGGFLKWFIGLPSWLRTIVTVFVLIGIFFLVAHIIGLVLPFILLIVIIVYIQRMFRRR